MKVIDLMSFLSAQPEDAEILIGSERETFADIRAHVKAARTFASRETWQQSYMVIHPEDDDQETEPTVPIVVIGKCDR